MIKMSKDKLNKNFPCDSKNAYQASKDKYKNIDTMRSVVKNCFKFNQDLEILNYISSGSCGIVYEGKIRKSPNKKVALKFILNKILETKNEKIRNKEQAEMADEVMKAEEERQEAWRQVERSDLTEGNVEVD